MARKVGIDSAAAFFAGDKFSRGNTKVIIDEGTVRLTLHDNLIAERELDNPKRQFCATLAGWNTVTTRDRLNSLGCSFTQFDFDPFHDGVPVDDDQWIYYWSYSKWGFEHGVEVQLTVMLRETAPRVTVEVDQSFGAYMRTHNKGV